MLIIVLNLVIIIILTCLIILTFLLKNQCIIFIVQVNQKIFYLVNFQLYNLLLLMLKKYN